MYLRNQAHEGPWELVKSCTSGAPGSGEPSEEDVAPWLRGGQRHPWAPLSIVAQRGGPRPPKSPPSPPGEVEAVHLGAPPVQECADQLVVEAKAQLVLRRAHSGPHEVPLNQAH
jgi:hypothetical protein